jgi:hypothetical protein
LNKNLSQCHFFHQRSHMDWPFHEPWLRGEKPATKPPEPWQSLWDLIISYFCDIHTRICHWCINNSYNINRHLNTEVSFSYTNNHSITVNMLCLKNMQRFYHHHHHHHHHHVAIKELGHLLTRFGLMRPEFSSKVFVGLFCFLGCSFLWVCVICYLAFDLHVVSNFSCSPVLCLKLGLYLIILQSLSLFYDLSKCILLL